MDLRGMKQVFPAPARAAIGRTIRNLRREPDTRWGADFITEVRERLPMVEIKTIFDVGAHIGLTALGFSDAFPKADVYAFEPGTENLRQLHANLVGKPDVKRHRLALGAARGTATLFTEPEHPSMARIGRGSGPAETVPVETIDDFCRAHGVSQIDLMKIDTEGYELQVLSGAKDMLSRGAISIIKAECAIDPDLDYHTQLFALCEYLHPLGYRLFGIYEQWEDTLAPTARIRRFDAAFITRALYA